MPTTTLSWEAIESFYPPRSNDWFWAVGILGVACAVVAIIFNNVLFGIFILLASLAIILRSARPPKKLLIKITAQGVRVNNELFPFNQLRSFWIEEEGEEAWLVLHVKSSMITYVKLPIFDVTPDALRDFLLDYLEEEHHAPHFSDSIAEYLGF